MTIAELMLPEFDDEMRRTRSVLATVPADKMGWSPGGDLHTIGWNANHIAEIVGWTKLIIEQNEFDIAPPGEPRYETPTIEDPAEVLSAFDEGLATARDTIAATPDDVMAQPWTMKMGGDVLFTIPKGACLRTWVFNHTVHHRGILSVYLRMTGVDLTPVYDG